MTPSSTEPGRDAFEAREWTRAFEELERADGAGTLAATDLERFATAAQLIGREPESLALRERAHRRYQQDADPAGAARCAFWLAMAYMERGEMAHAGGWQARAQRVLEGTDLDCAERGCVRVPEGLQLLDAGKPDEAAMLFSEVARLGERLGDRDVAALGRLGRGMALVRRGDTAEGAMQLDEVMIAVTTGELAPLVTGIVYCAVIEACHEMFDIRRAQEWTQALHNWCDGQPDLVPFRGRCLVYRAEIMQRRGAWTDAFEEAERAAERLSRPPQPAAGAAYYVQGELHRLRGAFSEADEAFRLAGEWGRRPEPGLALLRMAQGRMDAAATAIGHALNETRDEIERAPLLAAAVEIYLRAGEPGVASDAAGALDAAAERLDAPFLRAAARHARAAVELDAGRAAAASTLARSALEGWRTLDAPYEAARAQELLGHAARASGDGATADDQLASARTAFERLGAVADLRRLGSPDATPAGGLTPRELQVLRLVVTGMTNRAIAMNLAISEKTVARHVSNIFGKIGVSSRAAATAYAYEHDLV